VHRWWVLSPEPLQASMIEEAMCHFLPQHTVLGLACNTLCQNQNSVR